MHTHRERFVYVDEHGNDVPVIDSETYTRATIHNDRIRILPRGEPPDTPHHVLKSFEWKRDVLGDTVPCFGTVVLDEAHLVKKDRGIFSTVVRMLRRERVYFVTATPVTNTPRDITNMLDILWDTSGLQEVFDELPEPQSLAAVYDKDYHPMRPGGFLADVDFKRASPQVLEFAEHVAATGGLAVWVLNPQWYRRMGMSMGHGVEFGRTVLASVYSVIQRRRSMRTPLELPDGTIDYPGKSVPPTTIVTEDVAHAGAAGDMVAVISSKVKNYAGGPGTQEPHTQTAAGVGPGPAAARINMAHYRHGALVAFDANNQAVLERMDDGLHDAAAEVEEDLRRYMDADEAAALRDRKSVV